MQNAMLELPPVPDRFTDVVDIQLKLLFAYLWPLCSIACCSTDGDGSPLLDGW